MLAERENTHDEPVDNFVDNFAISVDNSAFPVDNFYRPKKLSTGRGDLSTSYPQTYPQAKRSNPLVFFNKKKLSTENALPYNYYLLNS